MRLGPVGSRGSRLEGPLSWKTDDEDRAQTPLGRPLPGTGRSVEVGREIVDLGHGAVARTAGADDPDSKARARRRLEGALTPEHLGLIA